MSLIDCPLSFVTTTTTATIITIEGNSCLHRLNKDRARGHYMITLNTQTKRYGPRVMYYIVTSILWNFHSRKSASRSAIVSATARLGENYKTFGVPNGGRLRRAEIAAKVNAMSDTRFRVCSNIPRRDPFEFV